MQQHLQYFLRIRRVVLLTDGSIIFGVDIVFCFRWYLNNVEIEKGLENNRTILRLGKTTNFCFVLLLSDEINVPFLPRQ